MQRLYRGLAFAGLLLLCQGHSIAELRVVIRNINGTPVPPGEVYVESGDIDVGWEETSTATLDTLTAYIDGAAVATVDMAGNGGVVHLARTLFPSDCMHTVQLKGVLNSPYRVAYSIPESVWLTPYSTCTKNPDCNKTTIGQPVDVATGETYHKMVDLAIADPLPITFTRRYESQSTFDGPLGYGWSHTYLMRLEDAGANRKVFVDDSGRRIYFTRARASDDTVIWTDNQTERMSLVDNKGGWIVTDKHQTKYYFDGDGRLTFIVGRNPSNTVTLGYTGSFLTTITDPFGRQMMLEYGEDGRLQTLSADTRTVTYTYNETTGNLELVEWSDASFVTYEYEDRNDPHNMTRTTDALGHTIEEHAYNSSDRVLVTQSDDGNNAYTLSYLSTTQTQVTNSLGHNTTYTYDSFSGLVFSRVGPTCSSCGNDGTRRGIERDRFLRKRNTTDARDLVTRWTYPNDEFGDARQGNPIEKNEGDGERQWFYTWNNTFNFPLTISIHSVGTCQTNKIVTYAYDTMTGDKLEEDISGCNGDQPFTYATTWTYDSYGQITTIDGPRTDVSDLTTYEYYDNSPSTDVTLRGRLKKVTNAVGQETTYADYDYFGNVGSVTDANGVDTTYLYDEKNRITEVRIKGSAAAEDIVTERLYDLVGNLDKVRAPNCVAAGMSCGFSTDYAYDTVNRLTEVQDALGDKALFTYDTEGNRTREEYRDPMDSVQSFVNLKYDIYNRLQYRYFTNDEPPFDPDAVFEYYTYFDDDLVQSEQDPEGHVTTFDYHPLKDVQFVRRVANTVRTRYEFDYQGNLRQLTEPSPVPTSLLATNYTSSDVGLRLSVDSPDTGTTSYAYDPAGNLVSETTADGVTVTRSYDALNRLTRVTYPDTSLNVTYSYDSPSVSFGIGRRTGMTDPSGTSTFHYDRRGLLAKEERAIGTVTYTTQYQYDKNGNLTQLLYPTWNSTVRQGEANYTYDAADRVALVTTKVNGATTTVATNFTYKPFGPRTAVVFGNLLTDSRTYGSRYEIQNWTVGNFLDYTHEFDNDLNLTQRTDNLNSLNTREFGYDALHRLSFAEGPWNHLAGTCGGMMYTYDVNGNRLCKAEGALETPTMYLYTLGTNRMSGTTGGEVASFSYDANGNITGDGTHTFQYSDANRLASVDSGATATYTYDGDGRRVIKRSSPGTTYFFYDQGGKLLTEGSPSNPTGADYLYIEPHRESRRAN